MDAVVPDISDLRHHCLRYLLLDADAPMLVVAHGQMDGAGCDGRLRGRRPERCAQKEIAEGAIGNGICGVEGGLRQLVGKDIVVVTVTILGLIENAVTAAEYGAVAERPVGHSNPRRELCLVGVGDVVGNSGLAGSLNQISEILVGHRGSVLRGPGPRSIHDR